MSHRLTQQGVSLRLTNERHFKDEESRTRWEAVSLKRNVTG